MSQMPSIRTGLGAGCSLAPTTFSDKQALFGYLFNGAENSVEGFPVYREKGDICPKQKLLTVNISRLLNGRSGVRIFLMCIINALDAKYRDGWRKLLTIKI